MIFDHIGFNVSDFATSKDFYLRALAPLGIGVVAEGQGWAMLGRNGKAAFWFGSPDGHNVEAVCHAPEA